MSFALVSTSVYGWMIGNLPAAKLSPQSCRLTLSSAPVKNAKGGLSVMVTTCSATIIGKSVLLGAAHCFVGKAFAEAVVQCPNDTSKTISNWTTPKDFKETNDTAESARLAPFDLAAIRIEGEFKADPLPLPRGPADLERLFEQTREGKPPECSIFGYGEDATLSSGAHNGRSVFFEEWKTGTNTFTATDPRTKKILSRRVEDIVSFWNKDNSTILFRAQDFDAQGNLTNAIRHGDSGGGLECDDANGKRILMGVTSGFSVHEDVSGHEAHAAAVTSLAHRLPLIKQLLARDMKATVTGQVIQPKEDVALSRPRGTSTH